MKIVSLLPSATELVGELGMEKMLCAISHECDTPLTVMDLPRATGSNIPNNLSQKETNKSVSIALQAGEALYTVDSVLLNEIKPDLILTQGLCDVCAVTPNNIQASLRGTQCILPEKTRIVSLNGQDFQGIRNDFMMLADAVGQIDKAQSIYGEYKNRWDGISDGPFSKRILLLEWIDPIYSPAHWVPEQIQAAGLISVYGKPKSHSEPMEFDTILNAELDAIGVICCGFGLENNIQFARQLAGKLSAGSGFKGEIAAFDANRCFSRPTFSVVEGAEVLNATFVHGQEVPGRSAFVQRS